MKMFSLTLTFLSISLFANTDVALIKMLRGDVQVTSEDGSSANATSGMWLNQGQVVVTGDKSFARLVFKDKTSSNVGANSQIEIKSFEKGEAGILNLIKGQIRTTVVKDALNQDKSKLFIKTKTAAMGVRGTDFHVSVGANEKTTVLTYTGAVSMIQLNSNKEIDDKKLDTLLNKQGSVIVTQGRFSSTSDDKKTVNQPVKIAPTQLAKLKENLGLSETTKKFAKSATETNKAITPPGISAKIAFKADRSKTSEAYFAPAPKAGSTAELKESPQYADVKGPPPEGINNGDQHAPAAGGFIDLNTGTYIEPPKGAMFDPNTETFAVPKNYGEFDNRTGQFLPPPPEDFKNLDSQRAPSSETGPAFVGEYKHVRPPQGFFNPNLPSSPRGIEDGINPNNRAGGAGDSKFDGPNQKPEDFFDGSIGDLDPCLVDINTCQDFNGPPPTDIGQPAFLNFVVNFPDN